MTAVVRDFAAIGVVLVILGFEEDPLLERDRDPRDPDRLEPRLLPPLPRASQTSERTRMATRITRIRCFMSAVVCRVNMAQLVTDRAT